MRLTFRPLLFVTSFVFLLLLARYPHFSVATGQTITVPTPGQIIVTKDHLQNKSTSFQFEVVSSNGQKIKFKLKDGQSQAVLVAAGTYVVSEGAKGDTTVSNIICSAGTVSLATRSVQLTVASGQTITCTFENSAAARIRVKKYNDKNGNGTRNKGEKYLKNWVFTVYDSTGTTIVTPPKKTNSSGAVTFQSLSPGTYKVCETLIPGWVNTQPAGPSPCYTVIVGGGQQADLLFGNKGSGGNDDDDDRGAFAGDADVEIDPALADGVEITDNPEEEYGPEWDDAPDATLVNYAFMPVVQR